MCWLPCVRAVCARSAGGERGGAEEARGVGRAVQKRARRRTVDNVLEAQGQRCSSRIRHSLRAVSCCCRLRTRRGSWTAQRRRWRRRKRPSRPPTLGGRRRREPRRRCAQEGGGRLCVLVSGGG